jgi:uncharacterized membrane protein
MAGIGFELKKLFNTRTASGYMKAYGYSAVITAGPFALMTGMVLAIQLMFVWFDVSYVDSQIYTASIIYSFVFSNIISSGFLMLITRYLADILYGDEYKDVTASLYGIIVITELLGGILAILFFWNKPLDFFTKFLTYIFYMQMLAVWLQGVYLTAVKNYKGLFFSYLFGISIAILLTLLVLVTKIMSPVQGALLAMDIGSAVIMMLFFVHVTRYFGYPKNGFNFVFLPYFEKHATLFFIALFYTLGLYLPNIIIWQGPLAVWIADTYVYAPTYDVATFYAFLSILPIMVMFVVSMELHFYEKYAVYFTYITKKGNFKDIYDAKKDLLHVLWDELRNIMEFQLVFTLIFLAIGDYFLPRFGVVYNAVNMYNLIVLGAFFTGIMQVTYTLLLYLEDYKGVLLIVGCFFLANFIFGCIGFYMGENTYGFTFFLAAALSFLVAMKRLLYFCQSLDYYVFCSRPVFYREHNGPFSKLVRKLYGKESF